MTQAELPPEVLALVHGPVGTLAHVEMLLALRTADPDERSTEQLAASAQVSSLVNAERILRELVEAQLISATDEEGWRYAPRGSALRAGVDRLAAMYNERPVTLIRALYERPVRPLHSFADAFRIRRDD